MILLRRLVIISLVIVAMGVFLSEEFNRSQIRNRIREAQILFLLQTANLTLNENRNKPEIAELEPARAEKLLRLWNNTWKQFTGDWRLEISSGKSLLFDSKDLIINRLLQRDSITHKELFDYEFWFQENNYKNRALTETDPAFFKEHQKKPYIDFEIVTTGETTKIKMPLFWKDPVTGQYSVNGFMQLSGRLTESPLPSFAYSIYLAGLMFAGFIFYRLNRKREIAQITRSALKFSCLVFLISAIFLTYRVSRIIENEKNFVHSTTKPISADNYVIDKNNLAHLTGHIMVKSMSNEGRLLPAFTGKISISYGFASLFLLAFISGFQLFVLYGFLSGKIQKSIHTFGFAYSGIAPAAIATLIIIFLPFFYSVLLSFSRKIYGEYYFNGLYNYYRILSDFAFMPRSFYYTLGVTVLWTAVNIIFHTSIGLALAMLLKSEKLRGRGIYRALLILPWAVPSYITALVWKGMFHRQFGVINHALVSLGFEPISWFSSFPTAFFANALTNTWLGFPFMMVIAIGALQSIPNDLYEAADIDGASRWQKFRLITAPLLKPAMYPSIILGIVWTFNMFNIIYLVSNGAPNNKTDILVVEAYRYAFENDAYSTASAYSMIIFFILLGYSHLTNRKRQGDG